MIGFQTLRERRQKWGDSKYRVRHPDTGEWVNAGRAGLRDEWKDVAEELADAYNILAHIKERSVGYFTRLQTEALNRIIEHTKYIAKLLNDLHDDPGILPIVWGQDHPALNIKRIGREDSTPLEQAEKKGV